MADLTQAVEAAAKEYYDENKPESAMTWEEAPADLRHVFREAVLPAVAAAAKAVRNATLDEVDAKFVVWTEREPVGSPEHVMLEAQRNTIAKMKEV